MRVDFGERGNVVFRDGSRFWRCVCFLGLGVVGFAAWLAFVEWQKPHPNQNRLWAHVIQAVLVALACWFRGRSVEWIFDPKKKVVTGKIQGLFLKKKTTVPFGNIIAVNVQAMTVREYNQSYRLALITQSEDIPLTAHYGATKSDAESYFQVLDECLKSGREKVDELASPTA